MLNITELDIFKSNNCRTDYLEIRDGYWHKSPVLGRYCGFGRIPELIKSMSSRMMLTFVTSKQVNAIREYRGFAAHYEGMYVKIIHNKITTPNKNISLKLFEI